MEEISTLNPQNISVNTINMSSFPHKRSLTDYEMEEKQALALRKLQDPFILSELNSQIPSHTKFPSPSPSFTAMKHL